MAIPNDPTAAIRHRLDTRMIQTVASAIRPLRQTYIQKPMKMPSGMVMAIVNTPHALSVSALMKATPKPASATTRIKITVMARQLRKQFDHDLEDLGVTRSQWTAIAVVAAIGIRFE